MTQVVVVGLGPAGADLLVPRARAALERIPVRFVRTERHPAVADLARDGIAFTSFDHVYEAADAIDDVYPRIVDELVRAATASGEVVYAVPGNPVVAERSVRLLHERVRAGDITIDVVPGVSFAELAWARVGVDPLDGARVVDGRALDPADLEAGGPVLVAQVDSALVASDVKLALLDRAGPDTPVTVLQRLGLPDEQVTIVPLAELDRAVDPDHLTTVFVELAPGSADTFAALVTLARRLRGPGGCPWDAEQTHHSLTRYLLEEAYEVVDAIEAVPADPEPGVPVDPGVYADLVDELGDLLFQVVFHAILGEEAGEFTTADVAQGIHAKLVRRHPHVFGEVEAATSGDVVRNWEQIKKGERNSDSFVESVSPGLPALLYTHKLFRKAASVGLEPGDRATAVAALVQAAANAGDGTGDADALVGDVLAAAVVLARDSGVDAESALRGWAGRYRARFQRMEALARDRGVDLHALDPALVDALWAEAAVEGGAA
ncbi:MAG: nucleoside triphosphate pyrophosphohydrolase [Acidimicrobiia bacterium]|jgi:tetrapyrrole methylase family protein/MazG family protein